MTTIAAPKKKSVQTKAQLLKTAEDKNLNVNPKLTKEQIQLIINNVETRPAKVGEQFKDEY